MAREVERRVVPQSGSLAFVFVLALPFYWIPFGAVSYSGGQLAYSPSYVSSMGWLKSYGGSASGDYRYSYMAAYYGVPYGNLPFLGPVWRGARGGTISLCPKPSTTEGTSPRASPT